ncbi:MFS transporter [Streptomyces hygroscopicus]|uniref:MFS transporter n=1 Tax=Streptomyces hygroscopicus TaxID=1912 RepID=UPI0007C6FC2D|nr:MFS transporter [Streptomyces hygroscopicus]GLV75496.1 MFS transporter [Streptomyces hygroscopicus subsp. hygroscopicus]
MDTRKVPLDDLPTSRFHRKVAVVAAGGPFCDGYLLGIIAVALPAISADLGTGALGEGLIGASALMGMFVGGLVFGPLTDRLGRSGMYTMNLLVFVVCSALQFFAGDAVSLFLIRFVMGIALGADYPIATALATEFLPRRLRGPVLASLVLVLWVGFTASYAVGYLMDGLGDGAWRWMLASAAVPSLVFLLLRLGTPESPRWLLSVGRTDEARAVVTEHLGPSADFDALVAETRTATPVRKGLPLSGIGELFRRGYGPMLVFCSVFWVCQVAPSFAVKTFQPQLLTSLGVHDALGASVLVQSFAIVGTALGMLVINSLGRRTLLLASMAVFTAALLGLGINPWATGGLVITLFIVFNLAEAAGSALQFVYPNELFPTELRGTGMGVATAVSRIGSAAGTFLLPLTTDRWGTSAGLYIAAGIGMLGLAVSWRMAPETRRLSLARASGAEERGHAPRQPAEHTRPGRPAQEQL